MQGFCDICESGSEQTIIDIGGKDFCFSCQEKNMGKQGSYKHQVRPCPNCKTNDPQKITISGKNELFCTACKKPYPMDDLENIAIKHLHCMN